MLVLSLHNLQTSVLQLSSKHSAVTASDHQGATDLTGERRWPSSCLCLEEEWLIKTLTAPLPINKTGRESQGGNVLACVPLKSRSNSTTSRMYVCPSWETSDIKCRCARWNTDKYPPCLFVFFPHLFLNRCCELLLYKICRKRQKQKNEFIFPPTKLKWETIARKLRNTCFVALKKKKKEGSNKTKKV